MSAFEHALKWRINRIEHTNQRSVELGSKARVEMHGRMATTDRITLPKNVVSNHVYGHGKTISKM